MLRAKPGSSQKLKTVQFGDTTQKIIEDERRLFYVALSRAVEELWIVTDTNNDRPSPFLKDLASTPQIEKVDWLNYPYIPPVSQSHKFLVKIVNQPVITDSGTFKIKDLLKSDGYKWDSQKKAWSKIIQSENFDLYKPFKNSIWAVEADGIEVIVTDSSSDEPIAIFHINQGNDIRLNFEQYRVAIDQELQNLGWTEVDGKEYLEKNYNKCSRHQLSDRELAKFLEYLRNLWQF